MVNNSLNLPPPRPLPKLNIESWKTLENDDVAPFVFVADNAFPLTTGIIKPYDEGLTKKKKDFWIPFITLSLHNRKCIWDNWQVYLEFFIRKSI